MAAIEFVTPEQHLAVVREVRELRELLAEFLASVDLEVDTARALRLTGIKSRTTLIAERQRPGTPLKHSKHGRSTSYSLVSCLNYKQAHRLAA